MRGFARTFLDRLTFLFSFERLAPAAVQVALDLTRAEVAELADAHGSGPCTRKGVGVRVPSSAPATVLSIRKSNVASSMSDSLER
jgi:hypothetical protein